MLHRMGHQQMAPAISEPSVLTVGMLPSSQMPLTSSAGSRVRNFICVIERPAKRVSYPLQSTVLRRTGMSAVCQLALVGAMLHSFQVQQILFRKTQKG